VSEPFVFVTGMFRSGTTLLARMMNAHRRIAFASDPYSWIFKSFRNAVAADLFGSIDEDAPLDDYYFDADRQELMTRLQATSLARPVGDLDRKKLLERTAAKAQPFSPAIVPHLDRLSGRTFADLLTAGLAIIRDTYGDADTSLVGFKEVWTNEFASHVLQISPEAKVIYIVRDPRAAAASNNVTDAKYPWVFLARQWRKLATYAWLAQNAGDRACIVRFEDLVIDPMHETRRLCEFLGVEFDGVSVDPTRFVDGSGAPWRQNTSYAEPKRGFDADAVERWREVLTPDEVAFIDTLCLPEMLAFGYEPDTPSAPAFEPPPLSMDQLSEWIRPYSRSTEERVRQDARWERERWQALHSDDPIDDDRKRRYGLDAGFFDTARALIAAREAEV